MAIVVNRAAAGVVAGIMLITFGVTGGIATMITGAIYLLLPMACIWFPDEMGSLASVKGLPLNETPGFLVIAGGWLLLLLPVGLAIMQTFRGDS